MTTLRLPSVFSDHMVLQRERPIPVWGWAPAGQAVSVKLGDALAETAADVEGSWRVDLPARPADGPLEMAVECGAEAVRFTGVLLGDVWLCSGQSNMGFVVQNARDGQREVAEADWPRMRLLGVPQVVAGTPQRDFGGQWQVCSPATVADFSAVAYFMGRHLHRELDVPVGLIDSSWGGTPAEAWVPLEALAGDPELETVLMRWDAVLARYPRARADYEALLEEYEQARERARQEGRPEPAPPAEPKGPGHCWEPAGLYNAMVHPLVPYALRGAAWYQGESNAGHGYEYRALLKRLIRSWREAWDQGDFPFLVVQLANFQRLAEEPGESSWAELREAQAMALDLPNTGLAVTIDIGEADDIHPRNKQDVGKRLALNALHLEHGRDVQYSGPVFESMEVQDSAVRVNFCHADGLCTADGGPPRGFALAGEDGQWHWADARIEDESVVLSCEAVDTPVAVRYAWADNPPCNLQNAAGLPARPFRTDEWPGTAGSPGHGLKESYPKPEAVAMPHADREIEIDGDLSDWDDVAALPLPHHDGRPGCLKLAWDEEGFCGALSVETPGEPEPHPPAGVGPDCLELWVDKALQRTVVMTAQTSQYVFGPGEEEGEGHAHVAAGGDVYRGGELSCAWRRTDRGYDLEFHIPARLLAPGWMHENEELGLNYTLSIGGRPVEHFYTNKDTDGSWCTPVTWGVVRLEQ